MQVSLTEGLCLWFGAASLVLRAAEANAKEQVGRGARLLPRRKCRTIMSISMPRRKCRTRRKCQGGARLLLLHFMDNGTMRMCRTIMSSSITLSCMSCMRLHAT